MTNKPVAHHQVLRDHNGKESLEGVEKKRGSGKALRPRASNVGGTDVAGAGSTDIFVFERAHQHISKRNRTEKICDR